MADRTVLVLGAGSGAPYGFPLGQGLVDEICDEFPRQFARMSTAYHDLPADNASVADFAHKLRCSGRASIDAFLEHNPQFWSLGRIAIASALLPREQDEHLFPTSTAVSDNWYQYLFNWLADGPSQDFGEKPISLITYNYDRSLEHYLWVALRNSYNLDGKAAADLVLKVPIVHVHGKLGRLPWQAGNEAQVPFGDSEGAVTGERIASAARGLRIVYEDIEHDPALAEAHALLKQARKVFFLGFGYDRRNLERLRLCDTLPQDAGVFGTGYGLGKAGTRKVEDLLREMGGNVIPVARPHDCCCLEFLSTIRIV